MRAIAMFLSMYLQLNRARFAWCAAILSLAWSGCTPFNEMRGSAQRSKDAGADAMIDAADDGDDHGNSNINETKPTSSDAVGTSVASPDAGSPSIVTDCVGHAPGELFCVAGVMHVCKDITPEVVPCGRRQHCIIVDEQAVCACVPGTADTGSGCQTATTCDASRGGCDPLTRCSMKDGERTCGTCPPGYDGNGVTGCTPRLIALQPSCGEVVTSPTADRSDYRLRAPALCQRLGLQLEVPPNTKLKIDGRDASPETTWTSAPLPVGETTIQVSLTAENGVNRTYAIVVERATTQEAYVKASNSDGGDCFGFNLSASGETVVAGAPYEDGSAGGVNGDQASQGASESGAAYVYARQGNAWVQQGYLKADAPAAEDYFGTSVAVQGDTLVVGSPRHDPLRYNILPASRPGAAYVFVRTNGVWALDAKLVPKASANGDLFGFKVAVHRDTVLVSAPNDDVGGGHSGAVYVFSRAGGDWIETQKLKAQQPIAAPAFGFAIAIDGDTALIGASQDPSGGEQSGSAYVFTRSGGTWSEQTRLRATRPTARAVFGWQVALQGDTAVISAAAVDLLRKTGVAGQVFVFERRQAEWTPSAVLQAPRPNGDDFFGSGVSLSGNTILIGSNGANAEAGAAFLYARNGDTWEQTASLLPPTIDLADAFGQVTAVTEQVIAITAPFEDGESSGIDGSASSNGAGNSGAIYMFQ